MDIMARRGLTAHVPYEVKHYRRYGQKKRTERKYPVLTGYVLLPTIGEPPWSRIFALDVVKSVVGFAGVPAPIPDKAIRGLFQLAAQNVPTTRSLNKGFRAGDRAIVKCGPLADLVVKVEAVKGERARVLLGLLGSEDRAIDVPVSVLEAA